MNLQECTTIKECLLWAEERWTGFWEFANQKPMSKSDIEELSEKLDNDDEGFDMFMARLREVAKVDKTEEAVKLLFKGAGAFIRLEKIVNGS